MERIGAAFDAKAPVEWRGDDAWLSFEEGAAEERIGRAWSAAKEIWTRGHLELGLPVRIAVVLGPPVELEAPAQGAFLVDAIRERVATAPEKAVVVSEDIALSLPADERRSLAPAPSMRGLADDDREYVYPADVAGATERPEQDDLHLWSLFEEYGQSSDVREIPYVGFRLPRRTPPRLDVMEVFTAPSALVWAGMVSDPPSAVGIADEAMPAWGERIQDILARHRHLVVLGEPGGGKTTLVRWLTVVAASGWWPALTGELGPRLPLLLSVGRLAETISAQGNPPGIDLLPRYFGIQDEHDRAILTRFLERQLDRGRCAVLFDGLDEVRAEDRGRVEEWLSGFGARYPRNVFVSTSRYVGYAGLRVPQDACVATLSPLDEPARARFVRAFCRAYVKWEVGEDRPEAAEAQARALLDAIDASDRLASLARNPFMLSALALIHRAEGRLPRHRVQAYEMFLRALCETWAEARKLVPGLTTSHEGATVAYEEQAVPVLGALALAMHEDHPQGVAPAEYVRDQIARALEAREETERTAALGAADAFLKRASQEVQVLMERGPGRWGFSHLTFQEFFAAAGLHASERFEEVALAHLLEPRWEEIIRLGVGYLALIQKRPVAAQRFVEKVLAWRAPEPWTRASAVLNKHVALAALLAVEAGDALPGRTQRRIADAFAEWVCEGSAPDPEDWDMGVSFPGERWIRQIGPSDFSGPVAEAFARRLTVGSSSSKARAMFALARLPGQVSTEEVVRVAERDPALETRAIATLLREKASDAELVALMTHPVDRVRAATVSAVDWQFGRAPRTCREAVLTLAGKDASAEVRRAAAAANGAERPPEPFLGLVDAAEEVRLVAMLRDPEEIVRATALRRLRESRTARVLEEKERLAREDPCESVRAEALVEWARRGGSEALENTLRAFAEEAHGVTWDNARSTVAARADLEPLIPFLLSEAASPDAGRRKTAAFFLAFSLDKMLTNRLPPSPAVDDAVRRLSRDPEAVVRRETLRGLPGGALGKELAESALDDPDTFVREAAFRLLAKSGERAALVRGLRDESPETRARCLAGLSALPPDERVPHVEAAATDPAESVRQAAVRFLRFAGPSLNDVAQRLLSDPSSAVRSAAVWAIASGPLGVSVAALEGFLEDADVTVRRRAGVALAHAGDDGVAALVRHAASREARDALWGWAEQRGWVFRDPGSKPD